MMSSSLRRTLRKTATALVGAMLVGSVGSTLLAAGALAASATSSVTTTKAPPPWEPIGSPPEVGALLLFNSAGKQITGGSINAQPIAAYVEGTATIQAGDTKATLYGYLPVKGQPPGEWSGEALGASTAYPNSAAPAPLNTSTLPVETGGSSDESVAILEADLPNNDTSDDGYANMYVLRLETAEPEVQPSTSYDSADIEVNNTSATVNGIPADSWAVVYSPAATTTTLKASKKTITAGAKLTLTATETPVAKGSVAFYDGTTLLATVKVSTKGVATYSSTTLTVGTHSFTATFTPSNTDFDAPSTSAAVKVKVKS
jgi:Bacterial Ig-like domain (group 3)